MINIPISYPIDLDGVGVVSATSPEPLADVLSSPAELAAAAVVLVLEGPRLSPGRSLGLEKDKISVESSLKLT